MKLIGSTMVEISYSELMQAIGEYLETVLPDNKVLWIAPAEGESIDRVPHYGNYRMGLIEKDRNEHTS